MYVTIRYCKPWWNEINTRSYTVQSDWYLQKVCLVALMWSAVADVYSCFDRALKSRIIRIALLHNIYNHLVCYFSYETSDGRRKESPWYSYKCVKGSTSVFEKSKGELWKHRLLNLEQIFIFQLGTLNHIEFFQWTLLVYLLIFNLCSRYHVFTNGIAPLLRIQTKRNPQSLYSFWLRPANPRSMSFVVL